MTNQISMVRTGSIALAALVFLVFVISFSSTAHAADILSYDFYPDSVSYDFYPDSVSYDFYPDSSYTPYYPSSYSSYMPYSYSYPYSNPGYSYNSSSAASSVFAPSNTCTAPNSCNDNSTYSAPTTINAPTTVTVTSPSYATPSYSYTPPPVYYPPVYTPPATYAYNAYTPPTYYANAPYVSLSQVPYTGLDLGPVGTFLYWGFLILWALIAAYLIVVKRVQIKLYRSLNNFLFGEMTSEKPADSGHADLPAGKSAEVLAPSRSKLPPSAVSPSYSIDPFILSQINRARA